MMGTEIAVLAHAFADPQSSAELNLGGSETWITEFVRLLSGMGFSPVIYQPSAKSWRIGFEQTEVVGSGTLDRGETDRLAHQEIDRRRIGRIVYASSFIGEKHFRPGNVFIQHGIHWDYGQTGNPFVRLRDALARRRARRRDLQMCLRSRLTICVDTNFINCARAEFGPRLNPAQIRYIPNFSVPQDEPLWRDKWRAAEGISVVFARRFESRRGATLFADAVERLLPVLPGLRVTFAGSGSLEGFLREKFRENKCVEIRKVPHADMPELLNKTHIAVVPSLFSEGTAFSCLEAMASGCAVIATEVGGLGNLVIPDYNGLISRPLSDELARAVVSLANDMARAETMALRGYDMACHAFPLSLWRGRMRSALEEAGICSTK